MKLIKFKKKIKDFIGLKKNIKNFQILGVKFLSKTII